MKAVILSGSPGTAIFPFANYYPKLFLPLANEPLIQYIVNSLRKSGITEIAIISSADQDLDQSVINRFNGKEDGLHVSSFEEKSLLGTAGSLKNIERFIGSSHFLVISPNVFIESLDIPEILAFHLSQEAGVTMVVELSNGRREELENIEVGNDGVVNKIHILHHSRDNRRLLRASGIYIFNPCILDYIYEKKYMDIKEQLIPNLNSRGIPVHAYELKGSIKKISSLTDYFQLNREILLDGMNNHNEIYQFKTEIMDRIWVGKNVKISPKAYLLGPVIIGDNSTIEDHSQIIGPTSIGSGSHIEKDALVRESIIWKGAHLMSKARIEYSLIGEASVISKGETLKSSVVINGKKCHGSFNFLSLINGDGDKVTINDISVLASISYKTLRYKIFLAAKRVLDLLFSSLGLLLFLPIFIIISIAIKIDSLGPVFFCQKRCGREGKEFKMYKFRTMVKDAEKIHKNLIERKDIDGPMFKMVDDPRITKIGKILRKTSLDEFPQLFNVLKGDMSLVGPRPLIMEEMKFAPSWRDIRLMVKPGITGLWQINDRSNISFHNWIEHDISYVRKQSMWLDIKILMKTLKVVKGIGAR